MTKLTNRQAAIVSAYTGYLIGSVDAMRDYIHSLENDESKGPIPTNPDAYLEWLRDASRADYLALSPATDELPKETPLQTIATPPLLSVASTGRSGTGNE